MLLISPKEVDQQAVRGVSGMEIVTLPAVGLKRGGEIAFVRGFIRSYRAAAKLFKSRPPQAALAMGGFTSAPPILAARRAGAWTFLHESNTIPGRANRWLSRVVHMRSSGSLPRLRPLAQSQRDGYRHAGARVFSGPRGRGLPAALGLDPARPVLLVMGGSQGASGINELVLQSLPLLASRAARVAVVPSDRLRRPAEKVQPGLRGVEAEGRRASVLCRNGVGPGRGDRRRLPRGRILARRTRGHAPAGRARSLSGGHGQSPVSQCPRFRSYWRRPLAGAEDRHAGNVGPVAVGRD